MPLFQGWTSQNPDVERARALIAGWDKNLTLESKAAALYARWTERWTTRRGPRREPSGARVEAGLQGAANGRRAIGDRLDAVAVRPHQHERLPHRLVPAFDIQPVERPGAFSTVNANGANFRRIVDLSNLDNSVWTNAPGSRVSRPARSTRTCARTWPTVSTSRSASPGRHREAGRLSLEPASRELETTSSPVLVFVEADLEVRLGRPEGRPLHQHARGPRGGP